MKLKLKNNPRFDSATSELLYSEPADDHILHPDSGMWLLYRSTLGLGGIILNETLDGFVNSITFDMPTTIDTVWDSLRESAANANE